MAAREITPAQAFGIIAQRIEKRIEILQQVSESGYAAVIAELDVVAKQVRKAQSYFMATYSETAVRPRK